MSDPEKKSEREQLKKNIATWIDLLSQQKSVSDIVEISEMNASNAQILLNKNLGLALEAFKELEQSYRSIALFYKNTESDKVKNVNIMN